MKLLLLEFIKRDTPTQLMYLILEAVDDLEREIKCYNIYKRRNLYEKQLESKNDYREYVLSCQTLLDDNLFEFNASDLANVDFGELESDEL